MRDGQIVTKRVAGIVIREGLEIEKFAVDPLKVKLGNAPCNVLGNNSGEVKPGAFARRPVPAKFVNTALKA